MRWVLGAYALVVVFLAGMIIDSAPKEEAVATAVRLTPVTVPDVLAAEPQDIQMPLMQVEPTKAAFVEAERLKNLIPGETLPLPPEPAPTGIQGKPLAPEGMSGVEEMEFYRIQWDLPEYFGCERWMIGWKESNCRNTVSSYCCHGYWQLYVSLHLKDHRLGPRYVECGITSIADVLGPEPIKKQRNACGAKAVFDISGCGAWDTCPF